MLPVVEKTVVDPKAVARFTSESGHMGLAVDLLREVASYVCISSCIMGEAPSWSRDQAIIGGHAVRLYKLLSAVLDQVCQRRRETADILTRLVFETCVNVRFLIKEWSPDLADSFVQTSLRHERKLQDRINANVSARGGETLPIEERMLKSIDRTARLSGVSLGEIDLKQKAPWGGKHLAQKTQEIGWIDAYDGVFGGMSHNVHGAWQDLYSHHLKASSDGRFTPELNWSHPRPQPLHTLSQLCIQAADEVGGFLGDLSLVEYLNPLLEDLSQRVEEAEALHEAYLSRKVWPAT